MYSLYVVIKLLGKQKATKKTVKIFYSPIFYLDDNFIK